MNPLSPAASWGLIALTPVVAAVCVLALAAAWRLQDVVAAWFTARVNPVLVCVCGCIKDVHEHYRPGSDCGHCGRQDCPYFRARVGVTSKAVAR